MEKEKNKLLIWVKKHKLELIIAGISVTAIIAVILGVKNYEALEEMRASLKKLVEKTSKEIPSVSVPQVPEMVLIPDTAVTDTTHQEQPVYDVVREHIRNLHEGWKASPEKIAMAAERGYDLKQGQTLVDEYTRGRTAA